MKTKLYEFTGQYLAFHEKWELGVLLFFFKISLTVFFCITFRGLMSDLFVFPHRVIPALKHG